MANENPAVKYLASDISVVQKFMDDNIGGGKKMTGAQIYEAIKDSLSTEIKENVFKSSLSANVKAGNIKGFEGRRRVGYVKLGDEEAVHTKMPSDSDPDEETVHFTIQLTKTMRISLLDKRNYALQTFSGGNWISQKYNNHLGDMLKTATKYLINHHMLKDNRKTDLKGAQQAFKELETRILGELVDRCDVNPDVTADDHHKQGAA